MKIYTYLTFFVLIGIQFIRAQEYTTMIEEGVHSVFEIQKNAEAYFKKHGTGKGSGYKQYKRWEYDALMMMDENGYLKDEAFYFKELERFNKDQNQRKNAQLNDNWIEIGPTYYNKTASWSPGVGRITSFAVDRNNPDHIIIGSNVGGVWKTLNEGQTWKPLSDNYNNMDVFALAIDPKDSDTYYWGSKGGNVYKSTDAGSTWKPIGRVSNSTVNRIAIHPTNSNILFATSVSRGFYKSTDAGNSWTRIVSDGNSYDIEFKPNDPNVLYFSGTKVYKSTDTGDTVTEIGSEFTEYTKMMGVSPDNPDKLYVLESRRGGAFGAFYVSTDSGETFVKKDHGDKNYFNYSIDARANDKGQAPRDMDVAVSPNNHNEIHIAGINTWRSTDGGETFTNTSSWLFNTAKNNNIGYCHADVDIMEFVGSKLYLGTDGGIFIADDPNTITSDYYRDITFGLGIKAFYRLGVSQTDPVVITAGSQDNGASTFTESRGWTDWLGADGMECFVDKNNTEILYGATQNGSFYKSTNQGRNSKGLKEPEDSGVWVTPFEQDPTKENTIYAGYLKVYESGDGGETWNAISQKFEKKLNLLKIAPSDNTIKYASHGEKLYVENDGDGNWELLGGFAGSVNSIAVHPKDPNKIAIATTSSDKVYISKNAGKTWEPFRKNLPNFSALTLIWQDNDQDGIYVGMNYGVYYIDNTLDAWETFTNKLPNVRINELEINYADKKLYAATYGRGIWSSPLYQPTSLSVDEQKILAEIQTFPNPSSEDIHIQWKDGNDITIRLFNMQGRLLYYEKGISIKQPHRIPASSYDTGTYFLRINSERGVFTKKIMLR